MEDFVGLEETEFENELGKEKDTQKVGCVQIYAVKNNVPKKS